ncbi:unnamed protein product, partial [Phaeothamnion confervicola]
MSQVRDEAGVKANVFISYSRTDGDAAVWLRHELEARNVGAFRDLDELIASEEWWPRLTEMIAEADGVVLLLSPNSAGSKICGDEIAFAQSLGKRIFPALIESVEWLLVPEGLAKIHSVPLVDRSDRQVEDLVEAILTDIPWVREHTRLLNRARQWKARKNDQSELLREGALLEAEQWLSAQPVASPAPTQLHQVFIKASRDAERAEQ